MKLYKRFLIFPVILASFSYLFYSAYKDVRDRTLNEFNSQQFTLAKQATRGIESFFIYYQRELIFLSKLKYVSELNDQGKELLADFYNNHSDQIEAISVVDSKGILKYTFPLNNTAVGKDISNQPHIQTIIKTHKSIVSDVFTSVQGFRSIAYHVPIFIDNDYKGSIAILIQLDKLGKRFVENIRTGETGYGWMISEAGIEIYNPFYNQIGKSAKETYSYSPSVTELINKTVTSGAGTSVCYTASPVSVTKDSTKTLAAFYRVSLDNTFWTIIIFTPETEVLAKLTSFRNRLYILFSLILIVMATYFYLSFKASNILLEEKKRKAVEKILRESENRFRTIFELSPAGIILIDETGSIIEVNSSFCLTLGYSRKEILGKNVRIFASPNDDSEIEKNINEILSGKTKIHEVKNLRKDGTSCTIALYETKIILPDGKHGILSVSNDISEKIKAQQELISAKEKAEESDRLKSAFLANISHELRTPLNAIIGFSGLMIDTGPNQDTISYANNILKSGQHLLSLVEDIFDTTMIETGHIKINYDKTDIVSVLKEVKNILDGERLRENKNDVELILNSDAGKNQKHLFTDSRKLKQVLINLLRNALKFTDKGYIEFGFTEIEDEGNNFLQFYVKDTGIGIDKKHHDAIFNIFRQIDDTHTRKFGGMGIGLSIAKKTIEKLGGKIWVESERLKGSVFYFTLPVLAGGFEKEKETDGMGLTSNRKYIGKTILIAEDDTSNYDFLRIFLTRMNIRVLWAKDGHEAINLCETDSSIDLVFMDIKMPVINGFEATRKIKSTRPGLPVIAQTAYAMSPDRVEAVKSGCDDYMSKPIKIKQLTDILEKYL
jgi:PAS domain S-box-containing protein